MKALSKVLAAVGLSAMFLTVIMVGASDANTYQSSLGAFANMMTSELFGPNGEIAVNRLNITASGVPEPALLGMFGLALACLGLVRRK